MNEKIVVIGSNSFSGAHFVNQCLDESASVLGLSRSSEPNPIFLPYYRNRNRARFEFHSLDLNRDLGAIVDCIRKWKPDYVVNFAAQGMVAESWTHPEHWFQTNTVATIMLHDQLRKMEFLKKYVHVSTPEVYGSLEGLVKENTNYHPSTPYAVSRAAADLSLMSFFNAYRFPVVFTRAANVFGPSQQLYRIVPRAILSFATGSKLPLHGGGHSVRSFIHIRDVVRGTLDLARYGSPGEIFHFSTEENISIRKLVERIAEKMGVSFEAHVSIVNERLGKDPFYLLDNGKAKSELKWQPRVSLNEGLDECIGWVKENLEALRDLPWTYSHKE